MPQEPIERAKNRAYDLLARNIADLEHGRITEEEWYARGNAVFTPAYLEGDNPRAQSGHSGDEDHWRQGRSIVCDALHRDGTFLDVGCASGYLMESVIRYHTLARRTPDSQSLADQLRSWGFNISGSSERPHYLDERLLYKVLWIEAGA